MAIRTILVICLVITSTIRGEMPPTENYARSLTVTSGNMRIYWKFNSSQITFEVHGKTTGWIGIGFSPNGAMTGADIHVGWVKNGTTVVTDRHGTANAFPLLDPVQNLNVITGSECDGWTMIKFSRQIAVCEEKFDCEITQNTERMIWAWGSEDPTGDDMQPWDYHGAGRGVNSVHLLKTSRTSSSLPIGPEYKTFDVRVEDFPLPGDEDTYYNCLIVRIPPLDKKHHIVMYEPLIQEGNDRFVHHMLVYRCDDDIEEMDVVGKSERCFSKNMSSQKCLTLIGGWAVGGAPTVYPEAAGMSIGDAGDPLYVQIEIHYDNPFYTSGILDNSGMRFTYTDTLRQYDVGLLTTGVLTIGAENIIPPDVDSFTSVGHCNPSCFSKMLGDSDYENITVFSAIVHSHLAGRKMRVRHIRNGKELPFIVEDEFYDFNYQEGRSLDPFATIGPNDYLRTECVYNTKGRKNVTEFGISTRQEMCLAFLMYYPKIDLARCLSSVSHRNGLTYFGLPPNMRIGSRKFPVLVPLSDVDITKYVNATSPMTLEDHLNSFPWSPEKATEYEKFLRKMPYYSICMPQNRSKLTYDVSMNTGVKTPYKRPKRTCVASDIELTQKASTSRCYTSASPNNLSSTALKNSRNAPRATATSVMPMVIPVGAVGLLVAALTARAIMRRV